MPDEHGGRRDLDGRSPPGRAGNDLGGGARAAAMDRKVRRTAGALHRLEKRVCARAHRERAVAWPGACDAFWTHVPEAGYRYHRGELAASQGLRFTLHLHRTLRNEL